MLNTLSSKLNHFAYSTLRRWWIQYTIVFMAFAFFIFALLRWSGESMIAQIDGFEQHFPSVYYFGQYVRSIVLQFLNTGSFSVPMVDVSVGEGLDILTSMNYYGFGDPLNLIFIFANENTAEYFYALSLFLHLFLSGLFFGVFLRHKSFQANNLSVSLTPMMVYVFCGFNLYFIVQAPTFLCGSMFLPLLLLGVDRAMQSKKYLLLSFVVALMWISNFYFAFVNSVIAVLYVFLFSLSNINKNFFVNCAKTVLSYVLGFGLAATVVIPIIIAFLGSSRTGVEAGISNLFYYPVQFYYFVFTNLFLPASPINYWSYPYSIHLGFLPIVIPSVVLFLRTKTEKKTLLKRLKVAFVLVNLFAFIPIVGKLFNLMGYVTHRWAYLLSFVIACIVAWSIPCLKAMTGKQCFTVVFINVLYCLVLFLVPSKAVRFLGWMNALIVITIVCVIVLVKNKISQKAILHLMNGGTVLLVVCCVIGTYGLSYSKPTYVKSGVFHEINNSPIVAVNNLENDGFCRVAEPFHGGNINSLLNIHGVTSYYSITPSGVGEFYTSLGLANSRMSFWSYGLDDRASLNSLAGVKYYVAANENPHTVIPYGFEYLQEESVANEKVSIYQNKTPLSIGYLFDSYIDKDDFDKLSMLEKQEALLRYAVIDSESTDVGYSSSFEHIQRLESSITAKEVVLDGQAYVKYDLSFDSSMSGEFYLCLENVLSDNTRLDSVLVTTNTGIEKTMFIRGVQNHCYFGMNDMCINLGYSSGDLNACSFLLKKSSEYSIDNIDIYCINMDFYQECIASLQKSELDNVRIGTNEIEGTINASRESILQVAIPYSPGWTAYIDGVEVDVFQSGLKYCGIVVPVGDHSVRMVYRTPGIVAGLIMSGVSLVLIALWSFIKKKKDNDSSAKLPSILKYVISGGCTTLLDFLIYMALSQKIIIFVAKLISMLLASVVSFFLNKYWTFQNPVPLRSSQGVLFAGCQLVNILINSGINWLILNVTQLKGLAFIIATIIAMLLNFIMQKTLVFKKRSL